MRINGKLGVLIALVAAVSLLAATAAPAAAPTPVTGGWKGTTAQGEKISFAVIGGGTKVKRVQFKIRARCTSGTLITSGTMPWTENVSRGGRFEFHGSSGGSTLDFVGRFTARRQAKGSMTFNGFHPQVGSCHGGTTWKAHKA